MASRQSAKTSSEVDNQPYNVPTLGVLNPELTWKVTVVNDNMYESMKRIKERYSYWDSRQQRI